MVEAVALAPRVRAHEQARSRATRAGKPPVARTSGSASSETTRATERGSPRAPKRWSARRGRSAARSCAGCRCPPTTGGRRGAPSHASQSSSRSQINRWRRSRRSGTRLGTRSKRRCRQTTQLERSIEPPARSPFSYSVASSAELAGRAAATSPAIPAPAIAAQLHERERRLVLDVLDLHALGPHTNTAYVFGASTTSATSAGSLLRPSSARSTRTARWFRSGRSGSGIAVAELDERAAHLDPRNTVSAARPR